MKAPCLYKPWDMSETRRTLPGAMPFEIHPENAKTAVLCLHGYTGRTGDLKFQAEQIASAGIAVSVPRLPGAGTDLEDLSTTTRADWRRRTYDSWLDLRSRYESVSILGYSMGGLLALDLADSVDPEKLVLLAPALFTSHKLMRFTILLAPFTGILPEIRTGWKPKDKDDEETREHGQIYWTRRDLRSASQLHRLQGEVRRKLRKIRAPVFSVVSRRDNSVPAEVNELLNRRLPGGLSRTLVLNNCGHDVPQGADRLLVADSIINWLSAAGLN
jgi:carboxylesterase